MLNNVKINPVHFYISVRIIFRPVPGRCTNKICPYDHEVLKSDHNKKLINARGLGFLSENMLLELARVSADPDRSVINSKDKKIYSNQISSSFGYV